MKYLFILLLLCAFGAKAQYGLKFDKQLLDCENKWIAVSLGDEGKYAFGYVYLDNSAGLTFNLQGSFTLTNDVYIAKHVVQVKNRITPTAAKVAIIPSNRLVELKVEASPAELKYIGRNNSNDRYFKLAQTYNIWKNHKQALKYLEAITCNPYLYPNFGAEELMAQNTEQTKKIKVVRKVFKASYIDPYKQEIFWLVQTNKMKMAEETYIEAIRYCTDEVSKADMAYNIAYQYYKTSNIEKFNIWAKEVGRWIAPDNNYVEKVEKMQAALSR